MLKKLVIVLFLAGSINAGDVYSGVKAYEKKDYKTAFKLFQQSCKDGDNAGCNNLAAMYESGEGIKQDNFKAAELYKKTCDDKIAQACSNLGAMYQNGDGFKQSNKLALKYFGKACDMGDAEGCGLYAKLKKK